MVIFKLLIVVIIILVLTNRYKNIGVSLLIGGVLLALINNKGISFIINLLIQTLSEKITIKLALAILFISILGHLMDEFGYMEKMIHSLEYVLRSVKLTLLLTPAIMGTLLITGGALMSCPMIDKLGDKVNLSGAKKAAINLLFRHGLYFVYPLSPPFILALKLGNFELLEFIKFMFPMTVGMYLAGYFFLLREIEENEREKFNLSNFFKHFAELLFYMNPIVVSIVLALGFGMPFYLALMVGNISLIISKKIKYKVFDENIIKTVKDGININMIIAIIGILFFKNVVGNLESINIALKTLINSSVPLEIIIIVATFILCFSMASTQPGVGILFPLILPLASTEEMRLLYGMFIYVSSFMFYYTSPLHLCQVLTLEYFDVKLKDLYLNYRFILPIVYSIMLVIYFINI